MLLLLLLAAARRFGQSARHIYMSDTWAQMPLHLTKIKNNQTRAQKSYDAIKTGLLFSQQALTESA
jgi:hypothetical protein